jgi:hypothetical protein
VTPFATNQAQNKAAPIAPVAVERAPPAAPARPQETPQVPVDMILQGIEEESDDSGWAHLVAVGSYIQRIRADFDARLYGSKKLSDLLKKYAKHFVMEERAAPGSSSKAIYVRKPLK